MSDKAISGAWFADVIGTTRIDLPAIQGWIEVRNELSVGEERRVFSGAVRGSTKTEDGKLRTDYDAQKVSFGLVMAYVTDWSARDTKDKPVPFTEDAVRAMKPEIYHAIEDAVDAHAEAMKKAREQGNAPMSSESGGAPTSASAA